MLASAPVVCLILSASYIDLIVFPFILTKGPCAFDILLLAFAAALTPLCLTTAALNHTMISHILSWICEVMVQIGHTPGWYLLLGSIALLPVSGSSPARP